MNETHHKWGHLNRTTTHTLHKHGLLQRSTALTIAFTLLALHLLILTHNPAQAAATFVAADSGGGFIPDGGALDLPVPAGVQGNDILIAHVVYNAVTGSSITPSAGWTVIDVEDNPSHPIIQALYWRVATGSEPSQYGFVLNSGKSDTAAGAIAAYRGVDTANPIDAYAGQSNGTSTTIVAPSITTTEPGTTLIGFFGIHDIGAVSPPGAATERWDVGSNAGVGVIGESRAEGADELLGSAGPTGTRSATAGASDGSVGHLVALRPGDTTPPVITLVGADPQAIEVGSPYVELGATAWDVGDGDLTGSIVINATAVNTAVLGSYVATYDVVDYSGNAAVQVTRTVDVVDTAAPVITLVGGDPQAIEVGSPYVELGATAWDVGDGDLTGSIVINATAVNTAVLGSYVATYDVTDSQGNPAIQVTRTVDVVNTTIPVITLVGADPQTIEVGSGYVELGATALDNVDGDITGSITVDASAVNTTVLGSYVVTYDVVDSSGNPAVQVTRTVDVVDTAAPVVSMVGADPQTIEVGSGYVELGATALDNVDGDITGSIVIDTSAVNPTVLGSYTVTYNVTDSSGNPAAQVTRTVDVVDTTAPAITLVGADPQTIEVGSGYVELGATALDNVDGDITGSIVIDTSAVNPTVLGSYTVTYNVTDSSGNPAAQVTRTVDVVDTTAPAITLVGADPQTIEVGSGYVELGATALDNVDGDITGSIVIDTSAVNTAVLGSYVVTYDVTDSSGNPAIQVTRTVDVVDTAVPIITLVGANPQTIEVGSPYVELGATAFDIGDGDLTGSIVIDATAVNTTVLGSYVVTYDVVDSQGNPAIQATRTIDVVDTTIPVITLAGADPQTIEVGSPYSELGATAADNYDGDLTGSIVADASAVNTAVLGSYTVTYNVTDSSGNPAIQVTRTVDVVDTTIPVITLVGADPQTIEVGSPYSELGATAADNYDGDLTGAIVIDASAVNTAVLGSYVVTYDVTDSSANPAAQVTRTVDVVDTTVPVITLIGADPVTHEVGGVYIDAGATALDNYDGDITGSIVTVNPVNPFLLGSYTVTYNVTDSSGNPAAQVTRTVDVVDTTAPVITLVGADPQTIEVGSPYVELGATALDNVDGDITGSIVIDATSVNTTVLGSYLVSYDVTDAQGNPALQVTRTVDVVDTTIPVITLAGADPQIIEVGSPYTELGATALDNYDGDLTGSIVIDATAVNTAVLGSYTVTYDVTDSSGNPAIQITRTVDVVDTAIPVITLVGADPQTIEVGSPYIELGATAADSYDGDITGSIVIDATAVNTGVLGSYVVTYDVTDSSGNPAVQVTRTVDVVDITAPVITLLGADPQTIEVGSPYVELGATALDNYDGDISGSIVIDASAVNTAVLGSYVVTYNVDDSSGNPAIQVTRTVDVVDTTAPVITLVGADPQTIEVGSPYAELGATGFDVGDGDISGFIVIDAIAVNTTVLGSYVVTYNVVDSSGNPAIQVIRTVDVVDTTAPVITLVGADPQTIEVGSPYLELGATAADNYDGNITGSIVIDATAIDTAVLGSYTVTYNVADSSGNAAAQVTRTVNVVDAALPVITLVGANPQTIEIGSTYVELGATATDNYDGNLTGSIVIDASTVNTAAVGSYTVSYNVDDSSGNPAVQVTRTVTVVDSNDAPTIFPIRPITLAETWAAAFSVNASDPENHTLTYGLVGAPSGATIDRASGQFVWTTGEGHGPGTYRFTVTVTDNGVPNRTSSATATITVLEVNFPPVVTTVDDQTNQEGDTVNLSVGGSDPDIPANTLTWSASGLPGGLTVDSTTGEIAGQVAATAALASPYVVTITVSDNGDPVLTDEATFNWTILDSTEVSPGTLAAIDDRYTVKPGGTLTIAAPGVLSNDTAADGDVLTAALVSEPSSGTLTFNPDGSFTYATDDVPGVAAVTFEYQITDGQGGTALATVTITISANESPNANGDHRTLETYLPLVIDVLANDTDPEADTLTIVDVIAGGVTGRVEIDKTNNTIIYTPRNGFEGTETFSYVVVDTNNNRATAKVTINAPTAVNEAAVNLAQALGTPTLPFTSPPSDVAIAAVGLEIGSVTLLTQAFFQSIDALRVPLAFLIFSVLAVIILGGFTELPVLIAGRRRRYWSVVLLNREATLPVRSVASYDADVIYRFAPTATGIISLGKPEGTFLAIDTPRGAGYIDTSYLTTTVDLDHFLNDPKPIQIVNDLTRALHDGTDITRYISPRGLVVAVADKPLLITTQHLIGTLKDTRTTTETAAVALQIDLFEELRQTLLDTPKISHNIAHSRSALIPIELWNFPYLAIQAPNHSPWLIHFEYVNNKPYIAAINLDQ